MFSVRRNVILTEGEGSCGSPVNRRFLDFARNNKLIETRLAAATCGMPMNWIAKH
jgi:hypothetical protein